MKKTTDHPAAVCGVRFKRLATGQWHHCAKPAGHRGSCDGPVISHREVRLRELRDELVRIAERTAVIRVELDHYDALALEAEAIMLAHNAEYAIREATGERFSRTRVEAAQLGRALVEAADVPVDVVDAADRHVRDAVADSRRQAADGVVDVRLVKTDHNDHQGGQVTYRVLVDGQYRGLVGDGRPWRGWRFGGRKWWACWRQDGDTAARWSSELEYGTRAAALAALLATVGGAR